MNWLSFGLGALFASTCVALWERFSPWDFWDEVHFYTDEFLYYLLMPFVYPWVMVRLVFTGITPQQYKNFVTEKGTETKKLFWKIYYATDTKGRRFCTRHFLLRVRG